MRQRLARSARGLGGLAAKRARSRLRPLAHRIFFDDLIEVTGNFAHVRWLGYPIWQNVLDLWAIQEAIAEIKPALLIETGTNRGGSARFYAHLMDIMDRGRVVSVDVEKLHDLSHPRIEFLIGSSISDEILGQVGAAAEAADGPVMVILDADHARDHVAGELEGYGPLVTPGSLMLVQDSVIDTMEVFADDRPGPLPAIEEFLPRHPEFSVDESLDHRYLVSHHPRGWLRKRA